MTTENRYLFMILPLTFNGDVYILRDQWSDRATGAAKDSSNATASVDQRDQLVMKQSVGQALVDPSPAVKRGIVEQLVKDDFQPGPDIIRMVEPFRGYRDRGPDGFEVLEAVIDPEDIMSAPGAGRVGRHHFERLLSARLEISREDLTMKAGLDALYTRRDPEEAAAQFRKLLGWNPHHYSATFQLARALDQGGKRGEARPWWEKALKMAEASHDKGTAAAARARLAEQPYPWRPLMIR